MGRTLQDIRNLTSTVAEPLHYVMGTHAYVLRNSVAARLHALSEEPPYKSSYLPVDMFLTQRASKPTRTACLVHPLQWPHAGRKLASLLGNAVEIVCAHAHAMYACLPARVSSCPCLQSACCSGASLTGL